VAAATAARVVGIDINPEAARLARENAIANGVAERVTVLEGDLFAPLRGESGAPLLPLPRGEGGGEGASPVACGAEGTLTRPPAAGDLSPRERFDVILLNPPYLEGRVRSLLDHAMFDPGRRLHRRFFAEAGEFLAPGGCVPMVCSSVAEPRQALAIGDELGWDAFLVRRKRAWGETLLLYRLTPR